MSLNDPQITALAEAYANYVVETMDTKCLEQFVFDTILESLPLNGDDLMTEIVDSYDRDVLNELLDATGTTPSEIYGQ